MPLIAECPGIEEREKGFCWRCGAALTGRRRHWCSDECGQWWAENHIWTMAKSMAVNRDKFACVKCGSSERLEVNHILPREGGGYLSGCWNHLENLETLCHDCHVVVTNRQRAGRQEQGR